MATSVEADVVILGAGCGGLTCAVTARDAGLDTLVIEKSSKLGGVTALSGGHFWVPGNHLAKEAGILDSWQAGANYIERIGAGTGDRERLDALLANALDAYAYLEQSTSLRWNLISLADYYAGTAEDGLARGRYLEPSPLSASRLGSWQRRSRRGALFPDRLMFEELLRLRRDGIPVDPEVQEAREADDVRCGGAAIAVGLISALLDREVPIMTGVTTTALNRDPSSRRITGLRAIIDGEEATITAHKGVVLAAGSYDRNAKMVRLNDRLSSYGTAAHAGLTGDSLVLAGLHGAQTAYNAKPFLLGFHLPGEMDDEGAAFWRVVSPQKHSIFVNRSGRRFADEFHYVSVSHAMQAVDGRVQERPNLPAYLIADNRYRQEYGIGGFGPEDALPDIVIESPDLEQVGRALGIDGFRLRATVDRYNESARSGRDEDFHRGESVYDRRMLPAGSIPSDTLGTISEPPFIGIRLDPIGMGFGNTGLVGDFNGRILDWNNEPIDGLYGAGNSLAMLEIGSGYQSGFANMRGMTYGYLAARHLAGAGGTREHRPDHSIPARRPVA